MAVKKSRTLDPKPRPNQEIYIRILRRMTPEQHLQKALELSALTRELFIKGMRRRFPDLNPDEFDKLIRARLQR
jgi:hypothetical protein